MSQCLTLTGSTACPDFAGFQISTAAQGSPQTVADFDTYIINNVANVFVGNTGCTLPLDGTSPVRYLYSSYCALFVDVGTNSGCNQGITVTSLCQSTVTNFVSSAQSYFRNTQYCPAGVNFNAILGNFQTLQSHLTSNTPGQCLVGELNEGTQCGYLSNAPALSYCNQNGGADFCCNSVAGFTPTAGGGGGGGGGGTTTSTSTTSAGGGGGVTSRPTVSTSSATNINSLGTQLGGGTTLSAGGGNNASTSSNSNILIYAGAGGGGFLLIVIIVIVAVVVSRKNKNKANDKRNTDVFRAQGGTPVKDMPGDNYNNYGGAGGAGGSGNNFNNYNNNNFSNNNAYGSNNGSYNRGGNNSNNMRNNTPPAMPAPVPASYMQDGDIIGTFDVVYNYTPELSDEIYLQVGDKVQLQCQFDDGWAYGRNLFTNEEGSFPLACLSMNDVSQQGPPVPGKEESFNERAKKRVSSMYGPSSNSNYNRNNNNNGGGGNNWQTPTPIAPGSRAPPQRNSYYQGGGNDQQQQTYNNNAGNTDSYFPRKKSNELLKPPVPRENTPSPMPNAVTTDSVYYENNKGDYTPEPRNNNPTDSMYYDKQGGGGGGGGGGYVTASVYYGNGQQQQGGVGQGYATDSVYYDNNQQGGGGGGGGGYVTDSVYYGNSGNNNQGGGYVTDSVYYGNGGAGGGGQGYNTDSVYYDNQQSQQQQQASKDKYALSPSTGDATQIDSVYYQQPPPIPGVNNGGGGGGGGNNKGYDSVYYARTEATMSYYGDSAPQGNNGRY